ncbi:MAG: YCF48-related protein [Candidatus Kryptoniota bacterium]
MKTTFSILFKLIMLSLGTATLSIAQWSYQSSPLWPYVDLGKIQFVSDKEGWIAAANGSLLHTSDAGGTWSIVNPFPNDTVFMICDPPISMWWTDANHGWIIGSAGKGFEDAHGIVLYYTRDGGVSWSKYGSSNPGEIGVQVQFVNDTLGWFSAFNLLTNKAKLYSTTNGGLSWNSTVAQPPTGGIFYFVDANNGWGVNNSGIAAPPYGIIKTTDGGASWATIYADTSNYGFDAVQFLDVHNGWVVGRNAIQILKTTDGGSTWKKVNVPSSVASANSLFFLNADTGWIGLKLLSPSGDVPAIMFTADGGVKWSVEPISSPPSAGRIFSIYFRDINNGWFTQEQCVANCNGPDSLHLYAGLIGHTANNGGVTRIAKPEFAVQSFRLYQNYPNPFNPLTVIYFDLPVRSHVKLALHDILGREVKTLIDEYKMAGSYSVALDASSLPSGVYFYRLMASSLEKKPKTYFESKKLVVIK